MKELTRTGATLLRTVEAGLKDSSFQRELIALQDEGYITLTTHGWVLTIFGRRALERLNGSLQDLNTRR
ncbi:hypothetical protein DOI34_24620 [Salmonella enterica subsp. enterica serovar Virchow]|nr:hypothetical protein [Salmonella enterica subsp. enterica serovar Virchow]EFG8200058.1 hypothetical protein [Escherichia coli]